MQSSDPTDDISFQLNQRFLLTSLQTDEYSNNVMEF